MIEYLIACILFLLNNKYKSSCKFVRRKIFNNLQKKSDLKVQLKLRIYI